MRFRCEGILAIAAVTMAGLALLAPVQGHARKVSDVEASDVRGQLCKICEIQAASTCSVRNAVPCALLSLCTRCTMGWQNAYCVFNLFGGDCTVLAPVGCGNEEIGVCRVGTGICTYTGVFTVGCGTAANCI
jgi:hypothetical protein